ncbi:hypothetical protein FEM33_25180 [Dyadobacter flavalbus]|uniref:Uncharacterized protein n=1 Tax=Dyadobacter flavalbus TaxID=2579942 RepID=A0A5M8Q922_9BACT|nr:hypothetical protein [Dyadobacter flavalbus]KAA6431601.1 hypothetical protein FEM33_25180 [Dyadobacter flavalbus]
MNKIDVCVLYFGKPYQTIISILSLLKYSRRHINKIYITVEKKQPFDTYGDIYKVIHAIKPIIEIDLFYPDYFYNLDTLDYERVKNDTPYRWSIPYQYALENAKGKFLFIMHNDMVFHKDMISDMLASYDGNEKMAGTGSIGQCWSCPASFAGLCNGFKFQDYIPDQTQAITLHEQFDTPRKEKDIEILKAGKVHPLPECRLNEYACMINLEIYKTTTLPYAENVCFGGNWGFTADLGTGWFHQMVNQGYQFKHFILEDYAIHSMFNPLGQGIHAYSKAENYILSERNALQYLNENFKVDVSLNLKYSALYQLRTTKFYIKKQLLKVYHKSKISKITG